MGKVVGKYLISNKEKSCFFCGKPTNRIDINSEKRICSDACENLLDNKMVKYRAIYIRFNSFANGDFEILDKIHVLEDRVSDLLMKVTEENVLEILLKVFLFTNDTNLINSESIDKMFETGDIICFEKNKKTIKNKSKVLPCYLNLELKTLTSYMNIALIDISKDDFNKHKNFYFRNDCIL